MLLRSSSTPVLGSLISSFSETPNNIHYHHEATNSKHQMIFNSKLPCLTTVVSCNSSPIASSLSESSKGIRRAQSDGNLEGLVYTSNNEVEHFTSPALFKKLHSRRKSLMLETIPSFSLCNLRLCDEDDDDDGDEENEMDGAKNGEESAFGFRNAMENMALDKEWTVMDRNWNVMFEERNGGFSEAMHLARGLGLRCGGGGNNSNGGSGGRGFNSAGGDGGDLNRTEEYYKKMVKENPGNSLFLRNYAQFLYQTKQDLEGAKEYYWRAMLADPNDGEILSQYAKLVWELHRDQDRASNYFERAVQAAPEDSHVHAAYASFLWEIEEDEDECFVTRDSEAVAASLQGGAMVSAET